jgi:hypothetical protein
MSSYKKNSLSGERFTLDEIASIGNINIHCAVEDVIKKHEEELRCLDAKKVDEGGKYSHAHKSLRDILENSNDSKMNESWDRFISIVDRGLRKSD